MDQIVREGESAEFRCLIVPPPAHAVWLFRNDVIGADSDICRVTREGDVHVLTLPECFPEDSGRYTLRAVGEDGEVVEAGAQLIVEGLHEATVLYVVFPSMYVYCTEKTNP